MDNIKEKPALVLEAKDVRVHVRRRQLQAYTGAQEAT
jgi:hypothetical protein